MHNVSKILDIHGAMGTRRGAVTSTMATPASPYRFCQQLTPLVAHSGGPCTCYQRFG